MENFLQMILEYVRVSNELEQAQNDCESSWGFYLHDGYERQERAVKDCEESFSKLIKSSIGG